MAIASLSVALSIGMVMAAPATADGEDGNVTGGDVNYDGNTVPAAVQKQEGAKAKVAAAYRAVVDGQPGAAAAFDAVLEGYETQFGPVPATSQPQSTGLMTTAALIETRNLAVTHQAQINDFFVAQPPER